MKARMEEEEIMNVEDEQKSEAEMSEEEEEESEYEEYTDSEEEMGPRLKPVFVRKKDRITIQEKERQLQKEKEWELEAKKLAEDRRKHTLKVSLAVVPSCPLAYFSSVIRYFFTDCRRRSQKRAHGEKWSD